MGSFQPENSGFEGFMDLERLSEATDGTLPDLLSLIDLVRGETSQFIETLQTSYDQKAWEQMRRVSHKAAGSSAICGMLRLTPLFRQLEVWPQTDLEAASPVLLEIRNEFSKVDRFLISYRLEISSRLGE
jgi:HPt (histidine-containing phosphotransfer) domain-containing protein